ncbi:MAG: SecDF P1 head subdomain-containing protein [Chloroflexota bacterium]
MKRLRALGILAAIAQITASAGRSGTAHASAAQAPLVTAIVCARTPLTAAQLNADARLIQVRLTVGFGIARARVTPSSVRCLRVSVPGTPRAKKIAHAATQQGYIAVAASGTVSLAPGTHVRLACGRPGCAPGATAGKTRMHATPHPVLRVVLPGSVVARGTARIGFDSQGHPTVVYALTPLGSRLWCRYTRRHVSRFVAIVVDDRVLSDPLIASAICGTESQIAGLSSALQATRIVTYLNFGPLPIPLHPRLSGPPGGMPALTPV